MVNWRTKNSETYNPGSSLIWVRFAWLPTECSDGHTYWLVRLKCTYGRAESIYGDDMADHPSEYNKFWIDDYWTLTSITPLTEVQH